jgi:hypothetical protein
MRRGRRRGCVGCGRCDRMWVAVERGVKMGFCGGDVVRAEPRGVKADPSRGSKVYYDVFSPL